MLGIIFVLLLGGFTVVWILKCHIFNKPKAAEAFIKINFIDYKDINFYNEIILKYKNKTKKLKIKEKYINIPIYGFNNKIILKGELTILNSIKNLIKTINIINIKINNKNNIYYSSEIIFYGKNIKQRIKLDNFEYNNHNLKNRIRLLIYNFNEFELNKIIKDNNNKDDKQIRVLEEIKNKSNKLILLNIYINDNRTNALIFIEED